ncbi:hypothetical protein SARC_01027 [Sphaeroforma arctica JP610]|uniref:Uncharacterized protein n=1 Tax=Sphaeroforma arctica JP610 TaxID=667725 RepID=A0A0L0GD50_9EUKA|nr:hypothetical protein SARC_01027 [Sphaeroforma arctica JP610]KNC86834.1 hypothetical protein SARC_01027 [Sphaeroforma arctica JP610]|eukprot:XP_014160736.1 hypothetical protein SARC_01027 [Sphaeroforma arctica JP610]
MTTFENLTPYEQQNVVWPTSGVMFESVEFPDVYPCRSRPTEAQSVSSVSEAQTEAARFKRQQAREIQQRLDVEQHQQQQGLWEQHEQDHCYIPSMNMAAKQAVVNKLYPEGRKDSGFSDCGIYSHEFHTLDISGVPASGSIDEHCER